MCIYVRVHVHDYADACVCMYGEPEDNLRRHSFSLRQGLLLD